jgi:penicillin-binding protein 1A
MKVAVSRRPVEQFDTQVTLPEWQLEPDEEAYGQPDNGTGPGMMVDENGLPISQDRQQQDQDDPEQDDQSVDQAPPARTAPPRLDQQWIDQVLGRDRQRSAPH